MLIYKGKNCLGTATKKKQIWSKKELLNECTEKKLKFSTKMTKIQLCQLLIDNDQVNSSTKNICNISKDIKFKIFSQLRGVDFLNLCLTNKQCYSTCQRDDFWFVKVKHDYSEFIEKPNYLTYKQWYQRIIQSGNLYVCDVYEGGSLGKASFINNNVYKCFGHSADHIFYITMYNELYFYGDILEMTRYYYAGHLAPLLKDHINEQTKVMDGIMDFKVGSTYMLWLTMDGRVMLDLASNKFETKESQIQEIGQNIKQLFYHSSGASNCLFLSEENDLYLFTSQQYGKYILEKIAHNVEFAAFAQTENRDPIIYYVTKNGELWDYAPKKEYSRLLISKLGTTTKFIEPTMTYHHHKLIDSNVKSLALSNHYFFIIDFDNRLWIYGKDKLYTDPRMIGYSSDDSDESEDADEENVDFVEGLDLGLYFDLAGFNQDRYHEFDIKKVETRYNYDSICFLDSDNDLYYIKEKHITKVKLKPKFQNVSSFVLGSSLNIISLRDTSF